MHKHDSKITSNARKSMLEIIFISILFLIMPPVLSLPCMIFGLHIRKK